MLRVMIEFTIKHFWTVLLILIKPCQVDSGNVQAYQVLSAWLCEVTTDKVKKQPVPLKTECLLLVLDNYNPTQDNGADCPDLTCSFAPICDSSDIEKHIR